LITNLRLRRTFSLTEIGLVVRIVVVDPSRTILKAVSQLLECDGHAVCGFVDGQQAFEFITANADVDALIASAELESMSGLELCWDTRLLAGRDRAVYIILMSSDHAQLIQALDSGADEFIGKPPQREELYARLRSAERLLGAQRELIRLATTDPLTGVLNRRAFFERAERLCGSVTPVDSPVAIMFDVDHFKQVNDTYGHEAGDRVLRAIGRQSVGEGEGATIGRLGGEEFAILLGGSNLRAGTEYAESLRRELAALSFDTERGALSVTCSFGVAELTSGEDIDRVLRRADSALYKAKNGGRNRVVAAEPDAGETQWSGRLRSDFRKSDGRDAQPSEWLSSNVEGLVTSSHDDDGAQTRAGSAFVLDDEPQIGALVCKVLQACGIATRQFTAAGPFLFELKTTAPDLILLDLSLGQSDAVEIIRHLEANKYEGKVILISGRDEATLNEITQIGEKHGLTMLPPLKKPFRPADLRQRLSSHSGSAAPAKTGEAQNKSHPSGTANVQLVEALRNDWLEVWYQPKIDLKALSFSGAEALVRARHPVHGVITPDRLLPPAGDPAYQPLTKFVVERAMADWVQFLERDVLLKLSVNAPVSVIHTPAFIALMRSILPKDRRFPGLIVEVTEDEVVRDSEWAREIATQLKLYNVALSIDDFGSGYASLSRLNDLPFIEVKIDRSFVSGCASNPLKHGLCQTVVDLAHRFGASVCAEGVETTDDFRALVDMQCDVGQGFLFARPMPAAQLTSTVLAGLSASMRSKVQGSLDQHSRVAQTA
jgi:two-component system, cell cycle response regulator